MIMARRTQAPAYLLPSQVAALFHTSPKTVNRWAIEDKLPFIRTLGGHRRYPEVEIRQLVAANTIRPEVHHGT
jgi:excisionase family DNA binding protein